MENSNLKIKTRLKRRPLQIVIRWAVIVLVFLFVAWTFMPWWLPVGSITRGICDDIKKNTGLDASFGSVETSWGKGLVLKDFVISSPQGFDAKSPMLKFSRFHCDFSPIRMALGMRLNWCEIEGLEINARVDAAGNINLGSLKKLQAGGGESGGMVKFGRVSMSSSKFTLNVAGNPQTLIFGVHDLQFTSGRLSNLEQMTMTADVEQKGQSAPVNLQLAAKVVGSQDVARGMLNFVNVDLSQIPLPTVTGDFPIKSLAGRCDGMLEFHVNEALQVESLTLDLGLKKFVLTPADGDAFKEISQITLKTQAAMDAMDGGLDISQYDFEMPGLKISGSGDLHSEFFEGNWRGLEFLKLKGVLEPERIRAIVGDRVNLPEKLDGPLEISAFAGIAERTFKFGWNIDAQKAVLTRDGDVLKPAGDAMSMVFAGGVGLDDNRNTLVVDNLSMNFGKNVFTGGGKVENLSGLSDLEENIKGELAVLQRLQLRGTMQVDVAGSDSPVNGTWSIEGGKQIHITSTLIADEKTPLVLKDFFSKPAGKPAHVDLVATLNSENGELEKGIFELSCGEASLQLNDLTVRKNAGDNAGYAIDGKVECKRLDELAVFLPGMGKDLSLKGETSGTLKGFVDEKMQQPKIELNLNLAKMDIHAGDNFTKKIGDDFKVNVGLSGGKLDDRDVTNFGLYVNDGSGSIDVEGVVIPDATGDVEGLKFKAKFSDIGMTQKYSPAIAKQSNISSAKGKLTVLGNVNREQKNGDVECNVVCKPEKVSFTANGKDVSMNGEIKLSGKIADQRAQKVITGEIDGDGFDFVFDGDVKKSAGMGMKLTWELAASDNFIEKGGMLHLRSLVGMIGENRIQFAGVINANKTADETIDFTGSDMHLALNIVEPQMFASLLTQLEQYQPEGDTFVDVQLKAPARDEWLISSMTIKSDNFGGLYNKRRASIDGTIKFRDVLIKGSELQTVTMDTEGLGFSVDGQNGYLLADLSVAQGVPNGELSVLMDRFDLKDFFDWAAGPNKPQSRPAKMTIDEKEALKKQADDFIVEFIKHFAKADLSMKFSFDNFIGYDESVDKSYLFDKVYASLVVRDGKLAFDYNGGLAGGVSRGSYACNFLSQEPRMVWDSGTIDVQATPDLMPQINKDFPGNTVDGTFTNLRKVYSRLRDFLANLIDDRYPLLMVGEGKMMAQNGYVVGKAAPAFVTKMFPGLNLTKYDYQKMTAYQEYRANGISVNDAIFSGKKYDVYMNGTTDLDKNIEYTLGVQLLGSLSSADWKHDWRQGRIPLLKLRGRIEKGKLLDDVVTFPWPNETLGAIFIRNNLIYRAWLLKKEDKR